MLERLTSEKLVTAISLLGKELDPEVLVYLDQNVQEKVIDIIGPRALARAIPFYILMMQLIFFKSLKKKKER